MSWFRNISDGGIWNRGCVHSFEYLEFPPEPPEGYKHGDNVIRTSLLTGSGLFGEHGFNVGAKIGFASTASFNQIYDGEDFAWLASILDYLEVIAVELIETKGDGSGTWYKVTVKVAEDTPIANYQIIVGHVEGVYSAGYPIIDGADLIYLYFDGNLITTLGFQDIKSFSIIGSTANDGDYTTGHIHLGYIAAEGRTRMSVGSFLPSGIYDGMITNIVKAEVPC